MGLLLLFTGGYIGTINDAKLALNIDPSKLNEVGSRGT